MAETKTSMHSRAMNTSEPHLRARVRIPLPYQVGNQTAHTRALLPVFHLHHSGSTQKESLLNGVLYNHAEKFLICYTREQCAV